MHLCSTYDMNRYHLYTVQTSHNLRGHESKAQKTRVVRVHSQKSNFACACMCSVAEWIYSCWIIVSKCFIVLNRTLWVLAYHIAMHLQTVVEFTQHSQSTNSVCTLILIKISNMSLPLLLLMLLCIKKCSGCSLTHDKIISLVQAHIFLII